MELIVKNNYAQVSEWAANYIVQRINEFGPDAGKPFVLGLPTGSTPMGTYAALIQAFQDGMVSFEHVVTFNMDEYVGIPALHPQSYRTFMYTHFFDHVNISPENIHLLNGNSFDLEEECRAYETKIDQVGGIQLFLGGIGRNGHLAFNEPGSSFQSKTRIVELTQKSREANARFFEGEIEQVPKRALSVGIATVNRADEILILASGKEKAEAVYEVVHGEVGVNCPVSAIRMHKQSKLICDLESAAQLNFSK